MRLRSSCRRKRAASRSLLTVRSSGGSTPTVFVRGSALLSSSAGAPQPDGSCGTHEGGRRVKTIRPFEHSGLKLLSLLIGLLLWMMVSGEETVERVVRAPLELQQIAAGVELGGDLPSTVDVRLRGASGLLSRLALGDVVVALDL